MNDISKTIESSIQNPQNLLPHKLDETLFLAVEKEIEAIKADPNKEGVAQNLVNIILVISSYLGDRALEHEEIARRLQCYIKIFSVEKLKRVGLISAYEPPSLNQIFDENYEFGVTIPQVK
ncbi:MAG: hypothetical protein ACLFOC_03920 [Campylobacterales bacterium]